MSVDLPDPDGPVTQTNELASVDAQRDPVQGPNLFLALSFEHAANAGQFDQRRRS